MLKEGVSKSLKFAILSLVVLTAITTISALILSSSYSHAETSSVLASVTVPDVCTIAADNNSTAHTDTVGVGEYKANIGETVFNITCNDNNGYSIYAVGYSNNTVGNTNLIGTTNGATIPTGTSTVTGSSAVSNWAMKLTAVSGTFPATILDSYDSYHIVPSTATKVATRTSSIDLSADSQIKTTYAVSISPAQTADSYVGKVKYTVVHPNYSNADGTRETLDVPVNFAGQGVSSVTFTADGYPTRTVSTSGSTANLTAGVQYIMTANFTSGYEFSSWALNNSSYGTLSSTSANPATFTPNTNSGSAIITATGKAAKTYMQDLTLANCPTGGMTVYDKRDESSYTVKKLADGYCWMTQNLALDLTALTQAQLYGTGTNAGKLTNASNTTLGYLKGATTGTTSDKYPTGAVTKAWTSSYSYSVPMIAVDSTTSGPCSSASYCTGGSALTWSSTDTTSGGVAQGKVGVYYNYCAASAGSYCYGDGTSYGTSSGNASEDICPYGWHLPAGDTTQGSFYYLYNTGYSANYNNFVDALSTPLSGYFYSGKANGQGSLGRFWSSTWYYNNSMYRLGVDSSSVNPRSSSYRTNGNSVRCVRTS